MQGTLAVTGDDKRPVVVVFGQVVLECRFDIGIGQFQGIVAAVSANVVAGLTKILNTMSITRSRYIKPTSSATAMSPPMINANFFT